MKSINTLCHFIVSLIFKRAVNFVYRRWFPEQLSAGNVRHIKFARFHIIINVYMNLSRWNTSKYLNHDTTQVEDYNIRKNCRSYFNKASCVFTTMLLFFVYIKLTILGILWSISYANNELYVLYVTKCNIWCPVKCNWNEQN